VRVVEEGVRLAILAAHASLWTQGEAFSKVGADKTVLAKQSAGKHTRAAYMWAGSGLGKGDAAMQEWGASGRRD
jgi:hypothetical protein